MEISFLNSTQYTYILLPVLIFLARVCDVTIGTVRLITLSRGYRALTVALGFFELLVWLLAIGQLFQNLTNWSCYLAYAGGFATGNYFGMIIEERLALGTVLVHVITKRPANNLLEFLRKNHHGYTSVKGQGSTGDVHLLYLAVKRKNVNKIIAMIERFNPRAFYTIEDVRSVKKGVFPADEARFLKRFHSVKKSK